MPVFMAGLPARPISRLFLLQVRRIEHDQFGQLARGGRSDYLARESAFAQQGDATAVIQVGMRQQQEVDVGGFEAEVIGILLFEFASALIQAR